MTRRIKDAGRPQENGDTQEALPHLHTPDGEAETFEAVAASEVIPRETDWLSEGRLSMGALWFLDGNKGSGKSSIAAAVAAAITGGPPLPGGKQRDQEAVLWFAGEESPSMVRRKLEAAGADIHAVFFPGRAEDGGTVRTLSLCEHEEMLAATVERFHAKLIVLDTLSCFSGNADLNQDQSSRTVTSPLVRIAQASGCLVLATRHPRKTPVSNPLDRGMGNAAVAAAARGVLTTGKDPDYGRRVLGVLANNDGKAAPVICYELTDCEGVPCVQWGEEITLDPERIEFGVVEEAVELVRTEAKQLLRRRIGTGWVSAADVLKEARANGISQDALDRARWKLGVQSRRVGKLGKDGHWEYGPPKNGWPEGL